MDNCMPVLLQGLGIRLSKEERMNVIELVRFYPDEDKDAVTRKRQRVAQMMAYSQIKPIKLGCDWWFFKEDEYGKAK